MTSAGSTVAHDPASGGKHEVTVSTSVLDSGVLLVEDDAMLRSLFARVLRRITPQVWEAEDGPSALALYAGLPSRPDLVITDTMLPGLNGFELIRQIRAIDPSQLLLRISGMPESALPPPPHARDVPFVQKPCALDVLVRQVLEVLRR
jgi:CheY-like chemotaxis protein